MKIILKQHNKDRDMIEMYFDQGNGNIWLGCIVHEDCLGPELPELLDKMDGEVDAELVFKPDC